ncbi:hypothetical protein GCM10009665_03190 [Kitasatospora nipponensis]|uniref:Uncharacterized protein n=1 Tax=Kitasatospora nipponensis TaxID=258049 RepID=A0ABN1VM09_9ACTN
MVLLRDRVAELDYGNAVLNAAQAAQEEHSRRRDEDTGALRRCSRRLGPRGESWARRYRTRTRQTRKCRAGGQRLAATASV